jgi:hypothetical protein
MAQNFTSKKLSVASVFRNKYYSSIKVDRLGSDIKMFEQNRELHD